MKQTIDNQILSEDEDKLTKEYIALSNEFEHAAKAKNKIILPSLIKKVKALENKINCNKFIYLHDNVCNLWYMIVGAQIWTKD